MATINSSSTPTQQLPSKQLAPSQFSVSALNGALYRGLDGRWFWVGDGNHAAKVRDMKLGDLLPKFRMVYRYGKIFLQVPFAWRELFKWQGDPTVGAMLDAFLLKEGERSMMQAAPVAFVDGGISPNRKPKQMGMLLTQTQFDSFAGRVIPSWSAKDSVEILAEARRRSQELFFDSDDLDRELTLIRERFFSARALETYGHAAPEACRAWVTIMEEIRLSWSAGASRFAQWEAEYALGQAWDSLPPNFYALSKNDLWRFAQRFGPK